MVLSIGMALLSFVAYVYAARGAGAPPSNYWPPPLLFIAPAFTPAAIATLTISTRVL